MRYKEIVMEQNYSDQVSQFVSDFLVMAISKKVKSIPSARLLVALKDAGLNVTHNSMSEILKINPFVASMSSDKIELKHNQDATSMDGSSDEIVSDMANTQMNQDVDK